MCSGRGSWGGPDLVILPGTKNTMEDLLWLRQNGLEAATLKLAHAGTPILGVCGGYQMLGQTLDDPQGTESGRPMALSGLGLLPTRTVFDAQKRRMQVRAAAQGELFGGARLTGYEIHNGGRKSAARRFACWKMERRRDASTGMCLAPICTAYLTAES